MREIGVVMEVVGMALGLICAALLVAPIVIYVAAQWFAYWGIK